jgi:hypothetical protein
MEEWKIMLTKISRLLQILLLCSLLVSFVSCDGDDDDEGDSQSPPLASLEVGEVSQVATANSQATMMLETPTNQEAYLQVVYTAIPLPGTQPVNLRRSAAAPKPVAKQTAEATAAVINHPLQDQRILFDQYLRAEEKRIVNERLFPPPSDTVALFNLRDVQVGDQERFFILIPFTDQFVELTATARAVGVHSVFFVDDTNTSVSPEQVQQLLENFEDIIYPRDVQFFGEESDVNDDGRTTFLITSLLNDGNDGRRVVGFFFSGDLLPRNANRPFSNEQEILYVAAPTAPFSLNLIQATIAHEFQHLINFNQKSLQRQDEDDPPTEEVWLNEALSHLAEDLTGFSEDGDDLVNIVQLYLSEVHRVSLTGAYITGVEDTLQRRGAGYLFLRYLFEQTGGATYSQTDPEVLIDNGGITFLRQLETSPQTGIENIRAALREVDNPFQQAADPFREAFANWVVALAIDGTDLNDDALFNYQPPELDQITGQLRGIDLRGTREGREGPVTLQGPAVQRFNNQQGTLQGTGVGYVLFRAAPNGGETATITLEGNAESQLQLTVIRTQ